MKWKGALAGKKSMSNQTAAVVAAITTSVNWERKGINLQAIIEAANQGRLGGPLTDWLVAQKWNDEVPTSTATVEMVSNLIVRTAKVNRSRSQQEAIEATGRTQYTDREVVDAMPKGEGDEVEVVFFKPDLSERNGFISDDDLEKEFELRGLKPADPVSVAAVNEADPAFADEKPHGTHWRDAEGKWCYATFNRWHDLRRVYVNRSDSGWDDRWWFAGVRK
jgi:hypothetical protein